MESQETRDTGQIIQSLQTRLDRLESRNRLLTLALLALVGLIALAFGCASSSGVQEVVKAKAFHLVDTEGRVRAELSMDGEGSPALRMFDASEEEKVYIMVNGVGSACVSFGSCWTGSAITVLVGDAGSTVEPTAPWFIDGPLVIFHNGRGEGKMLQP